MKKVLSDWGQRIQSVGPGQKSHLLHSLTDAAKSSDDRRSQFRRKKNL